MYRRGYLVIGILVILVAPTINGFTMGISPPEDNLGIIGADISTRGGTSINGGLIINSDQTLEDEAASRGWPGNGSGSDPYRIENVTFDGKGNSYALMIQGTTHNVTIRNCTFWNATLSSTYWEEMAALSLKNSINILVESNQCPSVGLNGPSIRYPYSRFS